MPTNRAQITLARHRARGVTRQRADVTLARHGIHPAVSKPKAQHHGNFFTNFVGDVKDSVYGTPAAVKHLVTTNPVKTAKEIYKAEEHSWAPLVHGDFGEFWRRTRQHPLGPTLDAITIAAIPFTAGASAELRAGTMLTKLGMGPARIARVERVIKNVNKAYGNKIVPRKITNKTGNVTEIGVYSRHPIARHISKQLDRASMKYDIKGVGATARYGRAVSRRHREHNLLTASEQINYANSVLKDVKRPHEQVAFILAARGISPEQRVKEIARLMRGADLKAEDKALLKAEQKMIHHPKTRAAYKQAKADISGQVKGSKYFLSYLHAKHLGELDAARKMGWEGFDELIGERRKLLPLARARFGVTKTEEITDKMANTLRREIERDAKPEPIYVPERFHGKGRSTDIVGAGGAGAGRLKGPNYENKSVMSSMGRLLYNPNVFSKEFSNTALKGYYQDIHQSLVDNAVRASTLRGDLKGWRIIRERPSQPIGFTDRSLPDFEDFVHGSVKRDFKKEMTAGVGEHVENPLKVGDDFLVVPERLVNNMVREFTASSNAMRFLWNKPTQAWRIMVLGMRPGFLVNNMVGNTMLYAMHMRGAQGIESYVRAMGRQAIRRRGRRNAKTPDFLTSEMGQWDEFLRTHMSGQLQSLTHEIDPGIALGTAVRIPRTTRTMGFLGPTQNYAERAIREARIENELLHTPAVRHEMRQLTGSLSRLERLTKGAKLAFEKDPKLVGQINREVVNTLGDYMNMSVLERRYIRNFAPFWSWYKVITLIALKMPFHSPVRTNILFHLAMVQEEHMIDILSGGTMEIPDFLRGAVPLDTKLNKDDRLPILTTQGLNPFDTVGQLMNSTKSLVQYGPSGAPSEFLQETHPFIQAAFTALSGKNVLTGAAYKSKYGPVGTFVGSFFGGLPPVTLLRQMHEGTVDTNKKGYKKMFKRTRTGTALNFAGIPYRELSPGAATWLARVQKGEIQTGG